jgi:hypothetical protein
MITLSATPTVPEPGTAAAMSPVERAIRDAVIDARLHRIDILTAVRRIVEVTRCE